jgi:ATP-binding cassette, subfamily B, bacterial
MQNQLTKCQLTLSLLHVINKISLNFLSKLYRGNFVFGYYTQLVLKLRMQNPYFSLLRTAWKYAGDQRGRFLLIYTMFAVANVVVAMNPLFYGWFVDAIQQKGTAAIDTAWLYAGGFLLLRLVEWTFHGPARVMERQLAFNMSRNFMDDIYRRVLELPLDWHQEHHSGSTINKIRKSYEALRDFFQQGFVYLYSFGKFVFSFSAMLYFSPLFGAIGVILGFITVLIIIRFDKPFIKSLREVNSKEHEVSSNLFDTLSNIRTVVTLKLEKSIHESLLMKIKAVFPAFKRNVTINELKWFTAQMMVGLIYCVTVFGYVYQHWVPGEVFQIAGLIILIGYVNQFTSVFNDIASQYTQIVKFHTEVQNIKELDEAHKRYANRSGATPLPSDWKEVNIESLNFKREHANENRKPTGLNNLNMRIVKGQRIGLIGESGSGKSTLLSVLRGLYKPEPNNTVSIDGKYSVPFENISTAVTLLPQDPEIFENTILYNITLGLPFSEEEVLKVCDEAHFTDVINNLPDGLYTHMKEKGVNLSGGQKQRLALARGILAARSSDIILMDEPTSSVDPKTEMMIYKNMFAAFEGKAIISSLHRLHLLAHFDYIYILKDGTVVDEGTFEDLKRYSLLFMEMWKHQSTTHSEEYPTLNVAL